MNEIFNLIKMELNNNLNIIIFESSTFFLHTTIILFKVITYELL